MRNLLFDMADRYRNVAQIRLTRVSKDRDHAPPRTPTIVVNGRTLRNGETGTRFYADHEVQFEVLAWADIGAPLSVRLFGCSRA